MGCDSSKAGGAPSTKTGREGPRGPSDANGGGQSTSAGRPNSEEQRWPVCHFCSRRIPEKEYNAHTVMCDAREVTCWNSWCRVIVRQGDLPKHLEECGKLQKAICPKCGKEILAMEMPSHRDTCQPKPCAQCGELCITRIHKWCPKLLLAKLQIKTGPFAAAVLQQRYCPGTKDRDPIARANLNVARMQLLWRWTKCRALLEETIFRTVYKEMDLKKEGFAIFKAHDKVHNSHVMAPKRSRSVIQAPVVAPATSSHYFPANLNCPITRYQVEQLIADIKNHVLLPYPAAWRVFTDALNHLNTMPNVVRMTPPVGARISNGRMIQGCKVVVVGDLHGQVADLLHILQEAGLPSESNYYIFNGDFVDRGACGVEVLLVLFALMLACPKYVTLNRGNHECDYMNDEYGFDVEVSTKYDRNMFRLIQRCFCALPLATMIGNKVFVVHGGLPRRKGVTLQDISRIQRFRQIPMPDYSQPEEDEIFQDMLWSDPVEDISGWRESPRGAGVEFGADVTEEFLRNNKLDVVVRSHEECLSGYHEHHNGKLITVFSASNYDGPETNYGAVCTFIGDNADPSFQTYQLLEDDLETTQFCTLADSFALGSPTSKAGGFGYTLMSNAVATASRQVMRRRTKDDILRELRERVYQRRHQMMAYFSKLDRTSKGSVWMIEWVECMRNVLNLDLPWYFLRSYLVEVDAYCRIWYASFLTRFHNLLQSLWIDQWKQAVCAQLLHHQRANHRSQHVTVAFSKNVVNYNEFCSVLRVIDYTMSDAQLFYLFQHFDVGGKGHIHGPDFVKQMQILANGKPDPLHWDVDAMEQLQNIVIQGRSQLSSLFRVTSKDRELTHERFMMGMQQLSRGMRKQLSNAQKEKIYEFMVQHMPGGDALTFDGFLLATYVFDGRPPSQLQYCFTDIADFGMTAH